MKVEELEMYGKALEMPIEALKKQKKIVFHLLRREFGLLGLVPLLLGIQKHRKRLKKEYPVALQEAKNISDVFEKELTVMGSLFFAIADKKGRKSAQDFMVKMARDVALVSMPAIYQLNDLVKCEGDVFDNFKKMNRALFTTTNRMGTWKHNGFHESKNLLEFKVTTCANIELFEAIDCPELNVFGCEHDLAGYPLIEEATHSEFRRHCTLAKGGDCCHFKFYRKGTAPADPFINK
ncbi:L-2-amino-thiazoline-4-carboxylic acid hydrolase [Carboxylicivirga sp. RSCT41]|uniref:L-2-amino-thiazoline-4-carboxylic acid hydrolase n=1 Tax=Carboxylicivirga agarovorans TaxID=3417570 RepID=UPI003D34DDE1